ncbi:MAG: hypothetical protein MUO97_08905, partial [Dehalococcoidia bacterium]|nr:hypothetical protein [Dehalococcoidia bacterium]
LAPADPGGADTQVCAILTCTVGPPASWSMVPVGGGTTWSIVPGSCSQPVNLNTNLPGDWVFAFQPGEVAHEATFSAAPGPEVWDAQGKAIDKTPLSGEKYVRTKGMNFYGEITVNTGAVDWGVVPLGLTFDNDTYNPETGISITYLANGDYEGDIKSTDWAGATDNVTLDVTGSNPPGNPGEFGLEANDTSDNTTAVTVLKAAYTPIDATGTITPEGGDPPVATNTLWLALSASGILPETYSGSIYYQIANR